MVRFSMQLDIFILYLTVICCVDCIFIADIKEMRMSLSRLKWKTHTKKQTKKLEYIIALHSLPLFFSDKQNYFYVASYGATNIKYLQEINGSKI